MHHFVPDFDTEDEYVHNTNSSSLNPPRNSIVGEDDEDLMELLWHKGQVVVQNQRLTNKPSSSPPKLQAPIPPPDQNLFIQEDEMSSWLRDDDFPSDLLSPNSANTPTATVEKQMTTSQVTAAKPPVRNFMNFSRLREDFSSGRIESGPSISKSIVRESTHVIPTATPSTADGTDISAALDPKGKAVAENEVLGTSSSVVSKTEIEPEKMREATECRNKETKQVRGSKKRSRAAEVHNLSERKRRDRINERMNTLQELIPHCNKTDKASMLEEAAEYMKSLQLQVQMMSMGCGMMPMMYPGMQQQYMTMGMGMGMGMGMNQPLPHPSYMPFPNMPSGPHYPVHASDQSRVFLPNQQYDPTLSQTQYPGYMDPYKQFHSLHQTQPPQFQNEATSYPSSSRVSSSKESED